MNITETVKQLLIINILFFIGSYFVPTSYEFLALHYFESDKFKVWQPLTHMFMHGGIMHIAFNMFALYSFGSALEYRWGAKKFIFFYISCGLGAALLDSAFSYYEFHSVLNHINDLNISKTDLFKILDANMVSDNYYRADLLYENSKQILEKYQINQDDFLVLYEAAKINQSTAVGASGAIYGLLVAFAFLYPNAELALMFIPVPIKAKYFVPGILVIDLVLGLKGNSIFGDGGTGIAHFAHLGGAICGYLMMWYWKKNQFNDKRWN
jgi:membrane associated rhomboid family serine protease